MSRKHGRLYFTKRGRAHSLERLTRAHSLPIKENAGALALPRDSTEACASKATPEKLLEAVPTACKSSDLLEQGKHRHKQASQLCPENLQRFVPLQVAEEGTLPNPFYGVTIALIPRADRGTTKTAYGRPISLMTILAKILNKIVTNCVQKYTKRSYTMMK